MGIELHGPSVSMGTRWLILLLWLAVQGFSRQPKVGHDDQAVRMVVWE
jgi:hypothetical protein